MAAKLIHDTAAIFEIITFPKKPPKKFTNFHILASAHSYNVWQRMKAFFEVPPAHDLKVGDLVTCNCHGEVAIIIQLYDDHDDVPMNMAKIWWVKPPEKHTSNVWMHTIKRLYKYKIGEVT